jgi:hypothetical protein
MKSPPSSGLLKFGYKIKNSLIKKSRLSMSADHRFMPIYFRPHEILLVIWYTKITYDSA